MIHGNTFGESKVISMVRLSCAQPVSQSDGQPNAVFLFYLKQANLPKAGKTAGR